MRLNLFNLSIPALILSASLSFLSGSNTVPASGHWTYDEYYQCALYVYETRESATFTGESDGVAYFETSDGRLWGAYVYDSDLVEGETVTLTFENSLTKSEYEYCQEYGTRSDSGQIIAID